MRDMVIARLGVFGYEFKESDEMILSFSIQKAENTIKNCCHVDNVPEGLINSAVDMATGEFLTVKKTFSPQEITALDLGNAVKQIQVGDTNVSFAVDGENQTPESRLNDILYHLLNDGRKQFCHFRRLKW